MGLRMGVQRDATRRLLGLLTSFMLLDIEWARAFPSSVGFRAGAWELERSRSRSSKLHASKPNVVAVIAAASFMLCSPAIPAVASADAAVVSQLAELASPGRQEEGAVLVSLPASWDLYGRMQRVESTMFTKADAKEMRAEMKADAKEMRAEMKADANELRVETVFLLGAAIFYSNARMDKQRSEDTERMDKQRSEDIARMDKQRLADAARMGHDGGSCRNK